MKSRENYKTSNIVWALCHYFLSKASSETHITVTPGPSCYYVGATGRIALTQTELEEIISLLNRPKTPEMEYYYDDLVVSGMRDNEFALVGAMVDEALVTYAEGLLKIELSRYLPKSN